MFYSFILTNIPLERLRKPDWYLEFFSLEAYTWKDPARSPGVQLWPSFPDDWLGPTPQGPPMHVCGYAAFTSILCPPHPALFATPRPRLEFLVVRSALRRMMLAGNWEQAEGCLGRDNSLESGAVSGRLCSLGSVDTSLCGDPEQRCLLSSLRVLLPCKTKDL